MNPAALKIKGSPSDVFNRGKSNQGRKLTGTELPIVSGIRSGMDSRLFRKERKGRKKSRNQIFSELLTSQDLRGTNTLGHFYSL